MGNHIIHKQKVILQAGYEALSQTVANEVSDVCNNELPGLLQTVFDELADDDEIVRIDVLKINLGTIPADDVKPFFAEKAIEKIIEIIVEKKKEKNGIEVMQKEQSLREALIAFLTTGTLPWFIDTSKGKSFESQMQQAFEEHDRREIIDWLKQNYELQPVIVKRLACQFSDGFLEPILCNLSGIGENEWKAIDDDLVRLCLLGSNKTKSEIKNEIWLNTLLAFLHQKLKEDAIDELVKNLFAKSLSSVHNQNNIVQTAVVRDAVEKLNTGNHSSLTESDANKNDVKQKRNVDDKSGETQYVSNCGIVLLHPFLKRYFDELKLTTEKQFVTEEAWQRAVLLLHYLATGETKLEEWKAVLLKVLCGLALEETLPGTIELTGKEKEESHNLLQSVINYWTPLKNTSVEGLQSSFLQRAGKLEPKENGWLLTIEQKTIDVLLDKLPWGFSTIKLPWMKEMISVDWC